MPATKISTLRPEIDSIVYEYPNLPPDFEKTLAEIATELQVNRQVESIAPVNPETPPPYNVLDNNILPQSITYKEGRYTTVEQGTFLLEETGTEKKKFSLTVRAEEETDKKDHSRRSFSTQIVEENGSVYEVYYNFISWQINYQGFPEAHILKRNADGKGEYLEDTGQIQRLLQIANTGFNSVSKYYEYPGIYPQIQVNRQVYYCSDKNGALRISKNEIHSIHEIVQEKAKTNIEIPELALKISAGGEEIECGSIRYTQDEKSLSVKFGETEIVLEDKIINGKLKIVRQGVTTEIDPQNIPQYILETESNTTLFIALESIVEGLIAKMKEFEKFEGNEIYEQAGEGNFYEGLKNLGLAETDYYKITDIAFLIKRYQKNLLNLQVLLKDRKKSYEERDLEYLEEKYEKGNVKRIHIPNSEIWYLQGQEHSYVYVVANLMKQLNEGHGGFCIPSMGRNVCAIFENPDPLFTSDLELSNENSELTLEELQAMGRLNANELNKIIFRKIRAMNNEDDEKSRQKRFEQTRDHETFHSIDKTKHSLLDREFAAYLASVTTAENPLFPLLTYISEFLQNNLDQNEILERRVQKVSANSQDSLKGKVLATNLLTKLLVGKEIILPESLENSSPKDKIQTLMQLINLAPEKVLAVQAQIKKALQKYLENTDNEDPVNWESLIEQATSPLT